MPDVRLKPNEIKCRCQKIDVFYLTVKVGPSLGPITLAVPKGAPAELEGGWEHPEAGAARAGSTCILAKAAAARFGGA